MRILVASEWFLKLVVPHQARALRDLGHEVALVTRDHSFEFGGNGAERARYLDGLEMEHFEVVGDNRSTEPFRSVRLVRQAIAAWRPDVVSVHQNSDPWLLATIRGMPRALTIHDPEPHPGARRPRAHRRLTALQLERGSKALVVHSERLVDQLRPSLRGSDRLRFVPHGVDVSREPLPPPASPAVLLFGRLEQYKGIEVLVAAMRELWVTDPTVRLIVAGRGASAESVPSDRRIEFRNRYIREDEIPSMLAETSVCVLPYTQASQSGVGLLALSNGIPTVVTNVGGLPDLAERPSFMAPPNDPVRLASAIKAALDVDLRGRHATLNFARSEFDWSVVAQRYAAVLEEIA